MEKRTINIGQGTINSYIKDIDDLKALTLAIVLKAMFKNSIVTNFSIRKIISITGFNYSLAKLCIDRGIKQGMLSYINGANNTKSLKVNKLWNRNRTKGVPFQVIKFADGHINLYFKDKDNNNEKIFADENVRQSPKDYINKVVQAAILKTLGNRSKLLELSVCEYYKTHGMKNQKLHVDDADKLRKLKQDMNKDFDINDTDKKRYTGISYNTIASYLFTPFNGINRYKIQKLVRMCEKEGLIQIVHNFVMVDDEMNTSGYLGPKAKEAMKNVVKPNLKRDGVISAFRYQENCGKAVEQRVESAYYVTNEEGEIIRDLHKTGFCGKRKHKNCLFMQLGNDYILTSEIIKKRRKTQKERRFIRQNRSNARVKREKILAQVGALKILYTL